MNLKIPAARQKLDPLLNEGTIYRRPRQHIFLNFVQDRPECAIW